MAATTGKGVRQGGHISQRGNRSRSPRSWFEQGTDPAGGELGDKSPPTWPETDLGPLTSDRPGRGLGTDHLRPSLS